MLARVADIACITQTTLEWIHHASLIFLLVQTGLISWSSNWGQPAVYALRLQISGSCRTTQFRLGLLFYQPLGYVNPRTLLIQWICEWLTAQGLFKAFTFLVKNTTTYTESWNAQLSMLFSSDRLYWCHESSLYRFYNRARRKWQAFLSRNG